MRPDFSGWATKVGLKCADGRTIMPEAFKHMDGKQVPLVWHHGMAKDVENILGHVILHYKESGDVYADAFFNETPKAKSAKMIVQHGDINQLSIMATNLVERSLSVFHGIIREVSLVPAGANPGALIDFVAIKHSDGEIDVLEDEAVITTGLTIEHVLDGSDTSDDSDDSEDSDDTVEHSDDEGEESIKQVVASLSPKQKEVVDYLVGVALGANDDESSEDSTEHSNTNEDALVHHQEGTPMTGTRNVFDQSGADTATSGPVLSHADEQAFAAAVYSDMLTKNLTFKEAMLAHAEGEYGITNIEELFPDAKTIDTHPEWITRRMEWVETVLNGTKKLPFSKIKSMSADLTHEEARAKGYIKTNVKKEQFFKLAKRETGPKTIYKKQKLDRDDIIDATEFDVVAWLWVEMYFMLREEVARAILIGDGREIDDEDKIDEDKIRPIARDDSFYTDVVVIPSTATPAQYTDLVLEGREGYKGTNPSAFMTRKVLNSMLLLRDGDGRRMYRTRADLAQELEVDKIVEVPILEDARTDDGDVLMVLVNLADYAVGSTRGGEITKFDNFDIDVNQYKYLIEGRMSGALTKHKTAQVVVKATEDSMVTPEVPAFVEATGVVTIPSTTGVVYKNAKTGATLSAGAQTALAAGKSMEVEAVPAEGYRFPHNFDADWVFTRPAS